MRGDVVGGAATNMWRPVAVEVACRKDAPPPMWGHAVAAADGKIWIAGGRMKGLKNKLQRRTFCLDTGPPPGSSLFRGPRCS